MEFGEKGASRRKSSFLSTEVVLGWLPFEDEHRRSVTLSEESKVIPYFLISPLTPSCDTIAAVYVEIACITFLEEFIDIAKFIRNIMDQMSIETTSDRGFFFLSNCTTTIAQQFSNER